MGILHWLVVALYCNAVLAETVYYDAYTSVAITSEEKATRDAEGTTYTCVNAFETCSETEGRRLDGYCNNLLYPNAGAGHSQFERLLPAYYDADGKSARLKADNTALPSARLVRTAIVPDGSAIGEDFTQLGIFYVAFITIDFSLSTPVDTVFTFINTTDCCTAAGSLNDMCTPIDVPEDDTLSLVSGITCLNLTRTVDFQYKGCIGSDVTPPSRIQFGAANLDLKSVYGSDPQTSLVRQRLFEGGLFNYSTAADGKQWPEFIRSTPGDGMANDAGQGYFFVLMFWREHNRIAAELSELNPSWTDDELFEAAREITIAEHTEIFYYEIIANILGYDNLVYDGVLLESENCGFRDVYDEEVLPGWWTESLFAYRWFHSAQKATIERYTVEGELYDTVKHSLSTPASEFNTGNNMTYFAQGMFRSSNARADDRFDGYFGETTLGVDSSKIPYQKVFDLGSVDLGRGRSLGLAPYIEVVNFCEGQAYEDFDSLSEHLDEDTIEKLKELYETDDVSDVELLAAMWREKLYPGAKVPRTVYCLIVQQLLRNIQSDRHWYERPNRPNAFTEAQLAEIRKTSVARLFCDNIGGITESGITAYPYQPISDENPILSCDEIPQVDLSAWIDESIEWVVTTTK